MGSLLSTINVGKSINTLCLSVDSKTLYAGLQNGQIQKWQILSNPKPHLTIDAGNLRSGKIGE